MPNSITYGLSTSRGYGQWYPTGANWLANLNLTPSISAFFLSFPYIKITPTGKFYAIGTPISSAPYILYLDKNGNLIWAKIISELRVITQIEVDSDENLYILGNSPYSGFGNEITSFLIKIDNSGNLLWDVGRYSNGQDQLQFTSMVIGPSAIYVASTKTYFSTYSGVIFSFSFSGTLNWQVNSGLTNCLLQIVYYDNHLYTLSHIYSTPYVPSNFLTKYDTSGNIIWSYDINVSNTNWIVKKCALNPNDDSLWILAQQTGNPIDLLQITGLSSTPNINYQKTIVGVQPTSDVLFEYGNPIAFDNNMYICATDSYSGYGVILKFDNSNNLIWQRTFSEPVFSVTTNNATNSYNFSGGSPIPSTGMVANFPKNGNKTGSYTVGGATYTYGTGSYTFYDRSYLLDLITMTGASASETLNYNTVTITNPYPGFAYNKINI